MWLIVCCSENIEQAASKVKLNVDHLLSNITIKEQIGQEQQDPLCSDSCFIQSKTSVCAVYAVLGVLSLYEMVWYTYLQIMLKYSI